jgi:hypothetical protein
MRKIILVIIVFISHAAKAETIMVKQGSRSNALLNRKYVFMQETPSQVKDSNSNNISSLASAPVKSINKSAPVKVSHKKSSKPVKVSHQSYDSGEGNSWDDYAGDVELEEELNVNARITNL